MIENYLVVGLGNPGREYRETRHNVGFMLVDRLAVKINARFTRLQSRALVASAIIADRKIILGKPQTFMNLSGQSVQGLVHFYKLPLTNLLVAHDDLDLPFKTIRLKLGGGHAGHKGLISVIDQLSDTEFIRVRIGIGKPADKSMVERYVLEPLNEKDLKLLPIITNTACDAVTMIVEYGIQSAMNQYNERVANQLGKEVDAPSE